LADICSQKFALSTDFLQRRINERIQQNALRSLRLPSSAVDFCSNDYLGIAANNMLRKNPEEHAQLRSGSAGSRLLSGNYPLIESTEKMIAAFHRAESGLIFNSGYDANLGLLSCVAGKGDTIIYDYLSHASIRDGIRLSFAHSFCFQHNDLDDLEKKLGMARGNIFVVTESVFSMDGDLADLESIADICDRYEARLIVDEAHATGVYGENGEGLVQQLGLEKRCFARVHTFGKAVGCHGAIVLGSRVLCQFLINFCRPFIYTTSLPECSVADIRDAYSLLPGMKEERKKLHDLVAFYSEKAGSMRHSMGEGPIQAIIIPGNDEVKEVAAKLQKDNLDVRPILYPTVPAGSERLRVVLHAFNTKEQVTQLLDSVHSCLNISK
jgi:8-amino-7-oxononanoate synthase